MFPPPYHFKISFNKEIKKKDQKESTIINDFTLSLATIKHPFFWFIFTGSNFQAF